MQFISDSFIIIHSFALVFFLLIIFTYDLHPFVGTIAYVIIIFNTFCLLYKWVTKNSANFDTIASNISDSFYRKKDQQKRQQSKEKLSNFKKLVNGASNRMIGGNFNQIQSKNFWKISNLRQSQSIQDLRKLKLSDIQPQFSYRSRQSFVYREEGRLSKRIRAFLMQQRSVLMREKQTQKHRQRQALQMNAELLKIVKNEKGIKNKKSSQVRGNSRNKNQKSRESESISHCLNIIVQLINTKIQNDIDTIIDYVQSIDKFLQRSFSIHFSLQNFDKSHLSYAQIKDLIQIIQLKNVLPQRYTANVPFLQIKKDIGHIKDKLYKLPNFCLPSNMIRIIFAIAYLRKEFSQDTIFLADMRESFAQTNKVRRHLIRTLQDDRMFYNNFPEIKTRNSSVIVFLIIFQIIKKEGNKNSMLIKKIRNQLQL